MTGQYQHTPGPWTRGPHVTVYGPDYYVVATAATSERGVTEKHANADLIAAAPDLFSACKSALELIADMDAEDTGQVFQQLLAVIKRVDPTFAIAEVE